jgi:hypothetical protein
MHQAASVDAAAAELWATNKQQRAFGMRVAAGVLAGEAGEDTFAVPMDEAVDLVWLLASPDVYLQLTRDRDWPAERYEQWLAATLEKLLLGSRPERKRPARATRSSRSGTKSSGRRPDSA